MTTTFSANSTSSIILMAATAGPTGAADEVMSVRFAVGGTGEGPEIQILTDAASNAEQCHHAIYHAKAAPDTDSHTYTLQAIDLKSAPTFDTGVDRGFCILELKAASGITTEYVAPIHQMRSGGFVGARIV